MILRALIGIDKDLGAGLGALDFWQMSYLGAEIAVFFWGGWRWFLNDIYA